MENKIITTPNGYQITLKPFITGAEAETLMLVYKPDDTQASLDSTHKMIQLVVTAITSPKGEPMTGDFVEIARQMPLTDYEAVVEASVEVATGGKKESSTPQT